MNRRRANDRRGSVYVLVLAAALIIVAAGLGGLSASRLRHRTTVLEQSWHEAGLLAQSAVDHALVSVEIDSWWRETFQDREAVFGPEIPIGNGSMSWRIDDLEDADLADNAADPVRIYGRGTVGDSVRAYSVMAWPTGEPLDVLRTAVHADLMVDVNGVLDARGGPVSSNQGIAVAGSQVFGDVETPMIDAPDNVTGSVTSPSPVKTMPMTDVWSTYKAMATQISLMDVGSTTIHSALLGPNHNPFDPADLNPDGVYSIKVPANTHVRLRFSRIVGTLLVDLDTTGSRFSIEQGVVMSPGHAGMPVLLVYTNDDAGNDVVITCDGTLDEVMQGRNFNPAGTPYYGDSDSDLADAYPASIRGLIHVIRDRSITPSSTTTITGSRQIFGSVVADGIVEVDTNSVVVRDPTLYSSPPLGYTQEPATNSLLTNGQFEDGLTGWFGYGADISLGSDRHSGLRSVQVGERDSPASGLVQPVTAGLTNGMTYTSDLWVKLPDQAEDVRITLTIESDAEGFQYYSADFALPRSEWSRIVTTITPTWTGPLKDAYWSVTTATSEQDFKVDDAILIPTVADPKPRLVPVPGTWRAEAAQ